MIDSPAVWVLLPAFLPTPTEIVWQQQATRGCSSFSDTWHILMDGGGRASAALFLYGFRRLAPTAL